MSLTEKVARDNAESMKCDLVDFFFQLFEWSIVRLGMVDGKNSDEGEITRTRHLCQYK
jgi:hypothetical protein